MKYKAMESFEERSTQLIKLALELSAAKDRKEGIIQNTIKPLRQELIVVLASITKNLSRIFKL